MRALSLKQTFSTFVILFAILFGASALAAWTGPTAAPPNNNVDAPINVGSAEQIKDGGVGFDSLVVFGNSLFSGESVTYTNFGDNIGAGGHGFRDNDGTMEYKDAGGSWVPFSNLCEVEDPTVVTCKTILDAGESTGSGVYTINPSGSSEFDAYCDMTSDGGGWTLAIHGISGSGVPSETSSTVTPDTNARMTDPRISSLLDASSGTNNNIKVLSRGKIVSMHNNNSIGRGRYQIPNGSNNGCSAYDPGPDAASFSSDTGWTFVNGSGGGSIGYLKNYGFAWNLCSANDTACQMGWNGTHGQDQGTNCRLGSGDGAVWIR